MPPLTQPLSWPAQRWLYCRQALRQRAGRWAGWALTGLALANVGSDDPVATTLGFVGLLVMPVFAASQAGVAAWLGVTLGYAALISLLLRALRPVLWAAAWQEAVHALPVTAQALRRSDSQVLLIALTPLAVLLAGAWGVWAVHAPALRLAAAASLGVALGLGFTAGSWLVQGWRALPRAPRAAPPDRLLNATVLTPLPAWRALLWTAQWRGPARRTGRWTAGGLLLLCGLGLPALWRWPAQLPWTLATLSATGLVWLSRANALSREELGPLLLLASAHLPLPARTLAHWRQVQVLLPAFGVLSLLSLTAAAAAPAALWRPGVLLLWWGAQGCIYTLEVAWPPAQRSDPSARWWLCLVLLLALSSEVLQ
jgi:hypothetical protein